MYYVPLALQCIYGRSDKGGENGIGRREEIVCRYLRAIVGGFIEVFRRRGQKASAGKKR